MSGGMNNAKRRRLAKGAAHVPGNKVPYNAGANRETRRSPEYKRQMAEKMAALREQAAA